ncbi:hypothetical protein FB45DRAFT_999823 [Roridomyces roridus]|uniref:Uncharacterized protein n=1 Tax=Roridomyces roridus TaxID=1738132 RepID=A0AAD7CCZ6_9AGAR|nr:hypothetical protein FB45DRAFT_999823 [Roridomyces roridus]
MCEGTYGTGGRGRRIRQMRRTPFGLDLPRQQNCTTRVRALEEEARRCSFYDAPILKRDKVESLDGLESEVRCCSGDRHAFSYDVWLRLQSDRCAVERDGEMQSFEDELWTGNEGALEVVPDGMGNFEDGHGYFAASAEWSRVSAIFQYIIARHRHTIAAYPYTTAASPTRIAAALLSCRRGSTALVA